MLSQLSLIIIGTLAAMTEAVDYDARKMLCDVNKLRVRYGLHPLGHHSALDYAAQGHCDYQAKTRHMSHSGKNGSNPGDRVKRAGYDWKSVAENVAYGYDDQVSCLKTWMNSPGHRKNILGSKFTHFGSAVSNYGSTPYYTQDFAGDGQHHNFPVCPGDDDYNNDNDSYGDYDNNGYDSYGDNNYDNSYSPSYGNYGDYDDNDYDDSYTPSYDSYGNNDYDNDSGYGDYDDNSGYRPSRQSYRPTGSYGYNPGYGGHDNDYDRDHRPSYQGYGDNDNNHGFRHDHRNRKPCRTSRRRLYKRSSDSGISYWSSSS